MDVKRMFSATFEESMNIVTEKYIKVSLEDFEQRGYKRKILGFFTVEFFIYLVYLLAKYGVYKRIIPEWNQHFFVFFLCLGGGVIMKYFLDLRKVKKAKILSYYYYNYNMFLMAFLFFFSSFTVLLMFGYGMVNTLIYVVIHLFLLIMILYGVTNWFYRNVVEALYQSKVVKNKGEQFISHFVRFAKKWGALIILSSTLVKWLFFPEGSSAQGNSIYENEFLRSLVILFMPLVFSLTLILCFIIVLESFQGYYIEKYSEEYREFFDYSAEEWYGKDYQSSK